MRALMFDLDGTLSNSVPVILRTAKAALQELQIEIDDETLIGQIGLPLVETGEMLLGPGRGQEYVDCYYRHYDPSDLKPFPGVPEMMRELKEAGMKLALVTSRRRDSTYDSLERIGLQDVFECVVCFEDTLNHKPHPEPLRFCCSEIGCAPDNACYIGDSVHDVECADAAGLWTCGVTWGASGDEIETANPVYLAHSVDELQERLLHINDGKFLPGMDELLARNEKGGC